MNISIIAMLIFLVIVIVVTVAWVAYTKDDSKESINKISNKVASTLFWGTVLLAIAAAIFSM